MKKMEDLDLEIIFTDNVSKEDISKIEKTLSSMQKMFSNYSPATSLIDDAILEGLQGVVFTPKDSDIPTGACYARNKDGTSLIKIDVSRNPIDIITAFLFELYNSVNGEIHTIYPRQYGDADEYANAMERAEYNTFINSRHFSINFLKSNGIKELAKDLLAELNCSETYEEILENETREVGFSFEKYLDEGHRNFYVQQWDEDKKLQEYLKPPINFLEGEVQESSANILDNFKSEYVDINTVIEKGDISALTNLLSSPTQEVYSFHISRAIKLGNNEILKLLLSKYEGEISELQIMDPIEENNLTVVKILLPYINEISFSMTGALKHEDGSMVELLLEKGKIHEYQLNYVHSEKVRYIIINHENYVSSADFETTISGNILD